MHEFALKITDNFPTSLVALLMVFVGVTFLAKTLRDRNMGWKRVAKRSEFSSELPHRQSYYHPLSVLLPLFIETAISMVFIFGGVILFALLPP